MVRKVVVVTGVVQGVGFRMSARQEAERLGLTGAVRNRRDGGVEVAIQGPDDDVTAMLRWLRKGPITANVRSFEVTDVVPLDEEQGFAIVA